MSLEQHTFANYHLARDNVCGLAPDPVTGQGLIPEMAYRVGVPLSEAPVPDEIATLVGELGRNAVLRENEPSSHVSPELARGWAGRSGSQQALDRNLVDPEQPTPWGDGTIVFATGGVANNNDRVAELLSGVGPTKVYVATGQRRMTSVTEARNHNVVNWIEAESGLTVPTGVSDEELAQWVKDNAAAFPTESHYAADVQRPQLEAAGHTVNLRPYDTKKGSEITDRFVADERHERLLYDHIVSADVANSGVNLAVQLLRSGLQAGAVYPSFAEQLYVLTDSHTRFAETPDHLRDPRNYQDPHSSIRQTATTARYMVIAQDLLSRGR